MSPSAAALLCERADESTAYSPQCTTEGGGDTAISRGKLVNPEKIQCFIIVTFLIFRIHIPYILLDFKHRHQNSSEGVNLSRERKHCTTTNLENFHWDLHVLVMLRGANGRGGGRWHSHAMLHVLQRCILLLL